MAAAAEHAVSLTGRAIRTLGQQNAPTPQWDVKPIVESLRDSAPTLRSALAASALRAARYKRSGNGRTRDE